MMVFVLRFAIIGLLALIGFQDFKFRGISWYLFPLLAALLFLLNPDFLPMQGFTNVSFVLGVFLLLTLWFSLREGRLVNLLAGHMGLGDFLFLLCLSLYFSVSNFFLFYTLSLLLIALGTAAYKWIWKPAEFTIPLAGLQGAVLMIVLLAGWLTGIEIGNADLIPLAL